MVPYNNWEAAYQAAEALVASWTIEQAANITVRNGVAPGYLPFTVSDGPLGVSGGKGVSGWITPQTLASSWDISLVEYQHKAMAQEFHAKGYSVLLGPTTGPLGRSVYGSRLFEGWGSDPTARCLVLVSKLFRSKESSQVETNRTASGVAETRTSSNMDDRTFHELYLWPWSDGVRNGMGSVMCVMNRVNGTIGCENDHIQNVVLKGELGFQGFIVPDATAPVNRTAGLLNGLDWNSGYNLGNISLLLENGTLSEQVMREHAARIVATQLNYNPPQGQFPDVDEVEFDIVRVPESRDFIRKAGSQSIVLLKNEGSVLPLKNVTSVGVFGLNAANLGAGPQPILNFGDYQGETYASHLGSGGGSGTAPVGYLVSPLDALTRLASSDQAFDYRYILSDNYTVTPPESTGAGFFQSTGASISAYAALSDPCLVFINAFAKEGADRRSLRDPVGDKLVNDVATYCNNTIVVMNNAGVRLVDSWIEHPNVTAVLNAGTLGQESGNSITDVLFGTVNPSGKLVYTIAKDENGYNGEICPCCECDCTEGLYIDYRHFDQADIEPRYEFGYGLSYTTFEYSNFTVDTAVPEDIATYATGPIVQGGQVDLFDEIVTLSASILNTGDVAGAEAAQLYLTFPESAMSPVKQLRGFSKVFLEVNESQAVEFTLQRRDVSIWDTEAQKWKIEHGVFKALLGKSSRDIVAELEFEL
ncbi:putative beta-glucosidase N [Pseudocercospora fuligena]|uniref:beta-glucosidase n=1 Tax=Pseudocercospora fuligena TaxID=685502 RepID=A0A8H6RJI1_9PEZI|nr:putative beta-glucosidase N [Pseudocercospora fuligena]